MEREDTMEMVMRDGIRFLESLTRHYGPEEGMRIWEGIGEVVGTDVKGKIFFAMLTGETGNRVGFLQGSAGQNGKAVEAIKAIRNATGCGLKEAKDAYDFSSERRIYLDCVDGTRARELARNLRDLGCLV